MPRNSSTRTWRRPYTTIYNDNYNYGNSLYASTLEDIEKKYSDSISKAHLGMDRADVNLTSFQNSSLSHATKASSENKDLSYNGTSLNSDIDTSSVRKFRSYTDFDTIKQRILSDKWEPSSPYLMSTPSGINSTMDDELIAINQELLKNRRRKRANFEEKDTIIEERDHFNNSYWMEKCRDLQDQLDKVCQSVAQAESRVKVEVNLTKNKMQNDLTELSIALAESEQQNMELQKVTKKQAKQLADLQANYDEVKRHLDETMEQLGGSQKRCTTLKSEIDNLRLSLEQA